MKKYQKYLLHFAVVYFVLFIYFLPEHYFNSTINEKSYCLHKTLLGYSCPGCGFTRSIYYFTHFEIKKAFSYNATIIFMPLILIIEIIYLLNRNCLTTKKLRLNIYLFFCISLFALYLTRITKT